jgi:putative CocE/NonD family hydrolase
MQGRRLRRARRFTVPAGAAAPCLCALLWLFGACPSAAVDFDFHAPAAPADPATAAALKDLAQRVLPVYQEPDIDDYLDNLSAIQLVAGDYAAAYGSRESLRGRRRPDPAHPLGPQITLDLYAYAKTLEAQDHIPFAKALDRAFAALMVPLADQDAYAVTGSLEKSPQPFEESLRRALQQQSAADSIGQSDAVALIWKYLRYSTYRSLAPWIASLDARDEVRRYATDEGVRIRAPDGTVIDALVVRPRGSTKPLPALFQFTLEDSAKDARECAAHGYVGVVAHAGGARSAGGAGHPAGRIQVVPFQHDGDYARAVINWIARQPWSDGRVGMYGRDYAGFTPWAAATHRPRALKAIATVAPTVPGIDFPMSGGIFHNAAFAWSARATGVVSAAGAGGAGAVESLGHDPGGDARAPDVEPWRSLNERWYRSGRPYRDLGRLFGQPNPIFLRWLNHPSFDRFWQSMTPNREEFARIDIPVLTVTGYFAGSEPGALYLFNQHRAGAHADHTLVIGPFDGGEDGPSGALHGYVVDPAALIDVRALLFQWFDAVLKGAPRPALLEPGVNYEVMGANVWRHGSSVEAMRSGAVRFYLDTGVTGDSGADGPRLAARANPRLSIEQSVNYADRSDAAWTAPVDLVTRSPARRDSLVFMSDPLPAAVEVDGLLSGRLDFSLNKADVDLGIALYERQPNGDFVRLYAPDYEFRASYARDRVHRRLLAAGERQELDFKSERLTSRRLQAGSRLVMVLGVVKRPDRELNYGTGGDVSAESMADGAEPLVLHWFGDSYLEIPVRDPRADH